MFVFRIPDSASFVAGFRRVRGYGVALFAVSSLVLSCGSAPGQVNRAGLITQAVNESDRIPLLGNMHPAARPSADRGAAPNSMAANRMLLLLKRSPESEVALQSFIQSLHDANSPNFHRWLTPAQFGAQWGAADSDIATVTAWLQSHGFSVKGANEGKTEIEFSGTAGQIEEAFHTPIHLYEVEGAIHHANAAEPQIPAALAAVVGGIATLNDFYPRSLMRKGPVGIYDTQTHRVHGQLTGLLDGQNFLFVGPSDAAVIYNTPNKALNPAATGVTYDGTGATIGIAGDSMIYVDQIANYRSIFGLKGRVPQVVIDGATAPTENGDATEAYLDMEVSGGIAPGANVVFYTAANTDFDAGVNLAAARAINDNLVDILNVSFGECEGGLTSSGNLFYAGLWEQAATQGISVTVAAGDSGSGGCDDPHTEKVATYGLQVNGLASTPYNIAVGGTDFAALAGPDGGGADFTNYVSLGSTAETLRSALGYIPEVPWNDSQYNFPPGPFATSLPWSPQYANIAAAGGGKSNCQSGSINGNNLTCLKGYAKPAWQSGNGVPQDAVRDLPDISLFTGDGLNGAAWGICTDQDQDSNGNPITDCVPGANGLPANEFNIYPVGGTSASAPAFAGILALVRQATGQRQGQADYVLYSLAGKSPAAFHDVVTGNNSVPCAEGSTDCLANTEGANFLNGYNAGVGYDLASGLGSVNASALVTGWANIGLVPTATQLTLSPDAQGHGAPIKVDIAVSSASGVASGSVSLTAIGNPPSLPEGGLIGTYPLVNGSTGPLEITNFPGGTYRVFASYGGSATDQGSSSAPQTVTIAPEPTTTQLMVTATNPSTGLRVGLAHYGYPLELVATLCGARSRLGGPNDRCEDGIPTGTVTFEDGYDVLGSAGLSATGSAALASPFLKPGLHGFYTHYSGDNSFKPAYGPKTIVAIEQGVTGLTLTSSGTAYAGKPIVFTVELTTDSVGDAPTGLVELKQGKTVLVSIPVKGFAGGKNPASATVTFATSNLPPGTNPIEAVYTGDVNYTGSTSNSLEIKGKAIFSLAGTFIQLPAEHSTGSALLPLTSEGGYAGTVNFTCQLIATNPEPVLPECGMYPAAVTLTAGEKTDANMLVFGKGTKLPSGVTLGRNSGDKGRWMVSGGAVLACFCLFFGIPARHRKWRMMLSVLLLLIAVSGATGCTSNTKLISHGVYTFEVTGTDSVDSTIKQTAIVHVEVL